MNKKAYIAPTMRLVTLLHQHPMLTNSAQQSSVPSANFMSNPGIGEDDDDDDYN